MRIFTDIVYNEYGQALDIYLPESGLVEAIFVYFVHFVVITSVYFVYSVDYKKIRVHSCPFVVQISYVKSIRMTLFSLARGVTNRRADGGQPFHGANS